jgi:hypothetical protein
MLQQKTVATPRKQRWRCAKKIEDEDEFEDEDEEETRNLPSSAQAW